MINHTEVITLATGEFATITLKSLATAGYNWKYDIDKNGVLEVVPLGQASLSEDFAIGGSAMYEAFNIKAIHAGSAVVAFKQIRAWDTNAEPVNIYIADVHVK